jgi:hypothetical protein
LKTGVILGFMPTLLPEALTAVLQLDRTAALAAAFVIGTHHADVLRWVAQIICGESSSQRWEDTGPRPYGGGNCASGPRNGAKRAKARKPRNGVYHRLAKREADDSALVEAMKADPDGAIGDWARAIDKSRTS